MFLRSVLFLILLSGVHKNVIHAQPKIEGTIVDAKTGEPLPYVNIGIVKYGIGTVSSVQGEFYLKNSQIELSDSVMFSAIGYGVQYVLVDDLSSNSIVKMSQKVFEFEDITVTAKKLKRARTYGHKIRRHGGNIGFVEGEPGDEMAGHIHIKKPTYIESAHFIVNQVCGDSMVYRVNIYNFENEVLGENLLIKNTLITGKQKLGAISVDISAQNIVVENDVLLALEYIEVDNSGTDLNCKGMRFRFEVDEPGNYLMRYTKSSKNVKGSFSIKPRANIGFYLVGREIR